MTPEKRLEAALTAYHTLMEAEGHDIYQIPDPVHITGKRGTDVVGRLLPPRACDFGGCLADGRAVHLDAKHCEQPRFAFSRLEGVQMKRLKAHAKAGGVAGVVVWIDQFGAWWLPVSADGVVAGVTGKASWTPDDGGAVKLTGVRWLVKEVIGG